MRRITTMFLLLIACSGDSDDDTTTTSPTTVPPPTTPGETSSPTETTAASDPSASSGLPTPTSTGDDAATSTPMTSGPMTTTETTVDITTTDVTTADDTTTGPPPVDCNAPPDCASCWTCARNGPCKAAYDACAVEAFCIPSLTCLGSMCTPDGLQPECAATCCMSCANLGTCDGVNAALACILPMCAAHCGQVTCGG